MPVDDRGAVLTALSRHLAQQGADAWTVDPPHAIEQRRWSVLYFLTGTTSDGGRGRWVVKCARVPADQAGMPGRDERALAARSRGEFESLRTLRAHFARQRDPTLRTIEPLAYLPEIEGLLMADFSGEPLYDHFLRGRRQLVPARRRLAGEAIRGAGAWLRWFHQLPSHALRDPVESGPQHAVTALAAELTRLREAGVADEDVQLRALQRVMRSPHDDERVAAHGDYHLRNVALLPDGGVLGLDTALDRIDSRCLDVARFVTDLRTRKERILSGARVPSERRVQRLVAAFLEGYARPGLDPRSLALYEALFTLRKWREDIELVESSLGRYPRLAAAVRAAVIDRAFRRLMRQWASRYGRVEPLGASS